jgi:hypothetical protein
MNVKGEIKERWQFDINVNLTQQKHDKSLIQIQKEIAAIIRQITSSAGFLPLFDDKSKS